MQFVMHFVVDCFLSWLMCWLFDNAVLVSTQMVLFEKAQFSGQAHKIYRDVRDATSLQLSPLISVKVVRGW